MNNGRNFITLTIINFARIQCDSPSVIRSPWFRGFHSEIQNSNWWVTSNGSANGPNSLPSTILAKILAKDLHRISPGSPQTTTTTTRIRTNLFFNVRISPKSDDYRRISALELMCFVKDQNFDTHRAHKDLWTLFVFSRIHRSCLVALN